MTEHLINYQIKQPVLVKQVILTILFINLFLVNSTSWALDKLSVKESRNVAYVAIIIDDLGYKIKLDKRATQLPGKITYAFLPHSPHLKTLAETVNSLGNEIMLHLPMQSNGVTNLGPGALTNTMSEKEFKESIVKSIHSIPHVKGINNHMGSLITRQKESMNWLMDEMLKTNLYFVDSRTTADTLAEQTANEYQIQNTRRDVFLDHEHDRSTIEFQFERLIKLAKKNGSAVGIGHPFTETLDVLEQKIPQLKAEGIQLVLISELIQQKQIAALQKKNQLKIHNTTETLLTQENSVNHGQCPCPTRRRMRRIRSSYHY